MDIFFYTVLFIFWLLFWSFSSVIIHRLKSWEEWIMWWRSHCPKCDTWLKFFDLIPIFSWLSTLWKCRYCKSKISIIYPILELSTWLIFSLIWYFLIDFNLILNWNNYEIIKLIYWLIIWFITILYIYYDILFLEIHEWIMFTWIIFAFLWLISNSFFINLLPTIQVNNDLFLIEQWYSILLWIFIISLLYIIMLKELKLVYDILILLLVVASLILFKFFFNITSFADIPMLSWLIWAVWIFIFFFLQIALSWWRALWWWDLRIWIMIWLLLWITYSFAWMMITYFVWSIISIFIIIYQKIKNKNKEINTQVPFWPFLGLGFLICIFFLNNITNTIEIYF